MAINSNCVLGDKNPVRSLCSSKTSNLSSCRLIKINFAGKDSCSSSRANGPNMNKELKSPYFTNDKVQVLSRVTAKKVIDRKPSEFTSSFPLAASVYKANSDEFKVKKRGNHKVKKSVLTLPNEPVPMPKTYTVSDLNDSEYFNAVNENMTNKTKKRRSVKRIKKSRVKEPSMEICDRDARYCSQLNIDLDCSSSEIVNFTGDGERISKMSYKSNNSMKAGNYPQDVWAVLRNINQFQFHPSPPGSQQSVSLKKRRPIIRRSNNNNDARFIETCRTEEFAYISSYEVDSKTRESCSPSSSFDRITVIDKQSEQDEIMQQFSRNIFGSNLTFGEKINSNINKRNRVRNKRLKNTNKKESHTKKKVEKPHQCLENNTHDKTPQLEGDRAIIENSKALFPELAPKTSSIFKPAENCSDYSSIKENDSASNDPTNIGQNGVRSGRDGNKCKKNKFLSKSPNRLKTSKATGDTKKQLNGITKVVLSKGKELEPEKLSERKPRLALTLPNTNVPKLSRLEIKRRIANQKYPLIILGKDQLTNRGIYVPSVDLPQFEGLEKHIWPYMLNWTGEKLIRNKENTHQKEVTKPKNSKQKNKLNHLDNYINHDKNMTTNISSNLGVSKTVDVKKKKSNTKVVPTINNKIQLVSEIHPHIVEKPKTLIHLKNKMFHFLHKNPSPPYTGNEWGSNRQIKIVLKDKQFDTNEMTKNENNNTVQNKSILGVKEVQEKPIENRIVPKANSPLRHPWAKGKWASDFIDNIIKKIRSGVYYGVDRKESKHKSGGAEASTQTEINTSKNAYCQNGPDFDFDFTSSLKKDDPLKNIPGFDQSLSTLEIETISTNKIAVKHCVTNVVVHFDIQVLGEVQTHTNKSISCIPLDVHNNQEKVFKCDTSIVNAILPAELCSIIPTMMQNILDTENRLLLQPTKENVQSQLTPLLEFTEPESPINSMMLGWMVSDEVRPFLNGRFQSNCPNYKNVSRNLHFPADSRNGAVTLTPNVNTQILCQYNPLSHNLHIKVNTSNTFNNSNVDANRSRNSCTVLQPYNPKTWSVIPYGAFNIADFIKQIFDRCNVNEVNMTKVTSYDFTCCKIFFGKPLLILRDESQDILSEPLSCNQVGVISLFNGFKKSVPNYSEESIQSLIPKENDNDPKEESRIPFDESKSVPKTKLHPIKVLRKKSYVRFYRKCNSMSRISNYKCTPLNRITNLEDFCQVLGSNLFCNVLDGCIEKKVMCAVEEMKNWISEINPKQALLVLLLTNKKDTTNLIRFRPVLLQGIAVDRITKADELDTEIEVIERENFKLSQYEGISYLPASPKNQDSLLEELYWIAKTTASDYQKTFDESSEKLLKSLLEKRKKLNPSYLRVMARYVGLGLLAPTKS